MTCFRPKLYVEIIAADLARRRDEHKDHVPHVHNRKLMFYKRTVSDLGAIDFPIHPRAELELGGVMFVRLLNEADIVRHRLGTGRSSPFQLSIASPPSA